MLRSSRDPENKRRLNVGTPIRCAFAFMKGDIMSISAALVKQLRDLTGAGMMDCKTALTETNGDIEAAIDWLRAKGISKADKKAGRTAAEGLIGVAGDATSAVVVEVNSETDFVARNAAFQEIVAN